MNPRLPRPVRVALRLVELGGAAALGLAVVFLAGMTWFAASLPGRVDDGDSPTDAIVVLTGGSERLETGLRLLTEKRGRKLFVSGVYRGVDVAALLRLNRQAPDQVECCLVLGYAADNTVGNALETAHWMAHEHFASLRLVTASYHMPRSLVEFRRVMPDVVLVPHPVFPDQFKRDEWWRWPGTAHLIATEYLKYLVAVVRDALLPPPEDIP